MDIVELLRKKISALEDGDYMPGLRAVQLHIETAFRHLSRGQETADDTAFTDAVHRTNLAFEGSIKEAYRVLAGQDPSRKRRFDIESYLETEEIFRPRVLSQFTRYRTEWRNPSSHDYKLDFDESESFLAIVSVTAFACVLIEQIEEHLAFKKSRAKAEAEKTTMDRNAPPPEGDLASSVANATKAFFASAQNADVPLQTEMQRIGSLHGFLSSALPNATVQANAPLALGSTRFEVDLLVSMGDRRVVIEVKQRFHQANHRNALHQVASYMTLAGVADGILVYASDGPGDLEESELVLPRSAGRVRVLRVAAPTKNSQTR